MLLNQCNETCGWFGAVMAALAFGTFGVPLKSKVCQKKATDPLVMQTYQTLVFFLLTHAVLLVGVELKWTNWGIVSGLCWVPGNSLGVYAIRNAGLAVSVGTWSSMIVMVSFTWGLFIFHEKVKSIPGAICAAMLLIIGLVGMSHYSAPLPARYTPVGLNDNDELRQSFSSRDESDEFVDEAGKKDVVVVVPSMAPPQDSNGDISSVKATSKSVTKGKSVTKKRAVASSSSSPKSTSVLEIEESVDTKNEDDDGSESKLSLCHVKCTQRQLGLTCAVINGIWGGSNLIPFHFAQQDGINGLEYCVSFGCGSMMVLILLWLLRFLYHAVNTRSFIGGYLSLPPFHFDEMWLPGSLAGAFFAVGKIFSIISVMYLGQGVGYSLTQSSMLVSGLWGIFYYGEITDEEMIRKWFLSASITISGILWLSYEHQSEH